MYDRKRTLVQLKKGDIINIRVPFEENTRDYYNGYKPEEIRSKPFTDRFGQSGKSRMIIYMGHDGSDLLYLPLTSRYNNPYDKEHQYELKDNSMTPRSIPDMKSYVEVDSLRAIKVAYEREMDYTGRIIKEDLDNIMHRVSNNTLQFNTSRDQRGIIPNNMVDIWEKELEHQGYICKSKTDRKAVYTKGKYHSISRTKWGTVYYHCSMTREQVHELVSKREGRQLPPLSKKKLDFSHAVNDMSMKMEKEKGDKQYATGNCYG